MRRLLATLRARLVRRDEGGTATVFVVGFAVVLLACAGLVIDGGSAINARMKLADDVEQAARAGAQQIDIDTLRGSNVVTLDGLAAEARARQYLNALGYTRVTVPPVTGDTITVHAEDTTTTKLLSLIGVHDFDIAATATAQAVTQ
ncbi:MAG TPA: pilus assembly protein TadG-related protein [Nocardioides sp.]|jgi:Flp pilus assembly protein TadG|nr:pilus assembly protein TadG-related protein [uncultured Nocardioides sp.]HEX5987499.1 pilus assembly protein TadG-related protein [Nocardioides sp.]